MIPDSLKMYTHMKIVAFDLVKSPKGAKRQELKEEDSENLEDAEDKGPKAMSFVFSCFKSYLD